MSTGLDAVYEELKRLQLEGMDRVFIEDRTLALLTPTTVPTAQPATATVQAIDLQSAINSEHKPSAPAPKVATRKKAAPTTTPLPEAPTVELPVGDAATQMQWLKEQVESSPVCKEHLRQDDHIVFGSGALGADIFYCGEAPGEEEAETGSPFQGKSGELLTKILSAMGLSREAVYMTNILKWRPKHDKPYGNRPPTQEEMEFCLPYLKAQIEIVQPKVIIALGGLAAQALLGCEDKVGNMRGKFHDFSGIPLRVTYHPSYILHNEATSEKRKLWEDMLCVMDLLGMTISEKQRGFFLPK